MAILRKTRLHPANWQFWCWAARHYRERFEGKRVVEVGSRRFVKRKKPTQQSLGLNLFRSLAAEYIGVDWQKGQNVDLVSIWHEASIAPTSVDTIVSASMLEHDPYHDESISKMAEVLVPNGMLFFSWGASRNWCHCPQHNPLCKKHYARPAELTVEALRRVGFDVGFFCYECNLPAAIGVKRRKCLGDGTGEVCLIAVKGVWSGDRYLDEYVESDRL